MSVTLGMFNVPLSEIKKPLQDLVDGVLALGSSAVLSADASAISSNTLAAFGLSRDVLSGEVYSFKIVLWITASANEGVQFDLHGGTATVSWLKATFRGYDGGSLAFIAQSTALATAVGPQDAFSGMVEIEGSFSPSADGTFAPRMAQTAHGSGSVQVLKGSSITIQ